MLTSSSDRDSSKHHQEMAELSADLLPNILQYCNDDTLLNTTSLVCRGWHDISRYLFTIDRLAIRFTDCTDAGFNQLHDRLHNLFHHASTFKWNHINHIKLKFDWSMQRPWAGGINQVIERADRFIRVVAPLVEKTGESLRSLSIHCNVAPFESILISHFAAPLLSLYPKIIRLGLHCNCQRLSLAEVVQIMRPLQDLKILSLSGVKIDVDIRTLPANLRKLFIRVNEEEIQGDVRCTLSRPHSILNGPKHFFIQNLSFQESAGIISRTTRGLNLTIESMGFRHSFNQSLAFTFYFDFSQFTELKSLTVDATLPAVPHLMDENFYIANYIAGLYKSLRTIKSLYLEEIAFIVPPSMLECPGVWVAIDRLLSLARFSSIQDVIFLVVADNYSGGTYESLVSLVGELFPCCLAVGRKVSVKMIEEKNVSGLFEQDILHYLPSSECSIIVGTRN